MGPSEMETAPEGPIRLDETSTNCSVLLSLSAPATAAAPPSPSPFHARLRRMRGDVLSACASRGACPGRAAAAGAQGLARVGADDAICAARVKPASGQTLLQGDAIILRQAVGVWWKGRAQRAGPADPICQMPDPDRIGVGAVVPLDHPEIPGDRKPWPSRLGLQHISGRAR